MWNSLRRHKSPLFKIPYAGIRKEALETNPELPFFFSINKF